MAERGFIKLSRKMLKWGWYSDPNTKAVFLDILLNANYEEGEYRGEKVHAGECVTGQSAMAARLGLSKQNVRTALKHLHESGEISTRKVTNRFSIITIEKWGLYQGFTEDANTQTNNQLTRKQHSANTQLTPSKKGRREEGKNIYYSDYEDGCKPLSDDEAFERAFGNDPEMLAWLNEEVEVKK